MNFVLCVEQEEKKNICQWCKKNKQFKIYSLRISRNILRNVVFFSVNVSCFKHILCGKQAEDTAKENDFHSVDQTQMPR